MGSGELITCDTCDLKVDVMLGIGFAGIPRILCACDTCKDLRVATPSSQMAIDSEIDKFFSPIGEADFYDPPEVLSCPSCRNPLRRLVPAFRIRERTDIDVFENESAWNYGPCPRCGGELSGRSNGVMWD